MLTRRKFLQVSAAVGAGAAFGCAPRARATVPADGPPAPLSVLRGSRAEFEGELQVISGGLPSDLDGHALIVGGIPYGEGTPLFTGDGMIYRLSFDRTRALVKTRLIRTDDFLIDEASLGMPDLAFRNQGFVRMSSAFGARDFANTAVVPMNDRLIATYDAGRPWELDPVSLDPITAVGLQSSWKPFLPPLSPGLGFFPINMATAHPCYDPDDDATYLVNYAIPLEGLNVEGFVRVLRWDTRSEPTSTAIVDEAGAPVFLRQSCHQMNVTRNWVILSDGAFNIEVEQNAGQDVTRPQSPYSVFYLIRKADLGKPQAVAKRVQLELESAHFLVDRDDTNDRLTFHVPHQNSADPSEWIRKQDTLASTGMPVDPALEGMMVSPADLCPMARYTIDAATGQVDTGRTRKLIDPRLWGVTLWSRDERKQRATTGTAWWSSFGFIPDLLTKRILDAYRDHPFRVVPVAELPTVATGPRLLRIDHDAGAILDEFRMPVGTLPMSPTFVPRKNGGPDEGYLVILTVGPDADEVWVFDASELSRGPLCRLRHAQLDIGFSLHTTWMGSLKSASSSGYRVDRTQDYGERMKPLSAEAQALAKRVLHI